MHRQQKGLFELADGGTLFLDEIGEIPFPMQSKLLRILEAGEFRRVGGREVLHADVRIVAATNQNLRQRVAAGTFREDLYYRLACITIQLPSLRERRSDIPALAEALLARINQANETHSFLSADAMEHLTNHDFPGNVRELRNILQRAAALSSSGAIGIRELGLHGQESGDKSSAATAGTGAVLPIRALEQKQIIEMMQGCQGNRRQTADLLGISERTLYRKLKSYGQR